MKVEEHISDLLFEHDCVIVPELGGFVANYQPAKIHPVQHTFSPPSKKIVFNSNLKTNDGLLASAIASNAPISYPEALRHISYFVDNIRNEFRKGAKVRIGEVGTLYLDVERNIQFEPGTTNYLIDSFGLAEFQSPAIQRENISKRITRELKDRKAIEPERRKINVKRIVALTIAVPMLAAMVWIPLKTDLLKNFSYSDLNPFAKREVVLPVKNITPDRKDIAPRDVRKDTSVLAPEVSHQPVTAQLVAADSTAVATQSFSPDFRFHIVAGCFQVRENAEKFVAMLKEQNLNAAIIGKNNRGLFVVSCGDFAGRKEALDSLQALRQSQPKAWLYTSGI